MPRGFITLLLPTPEQTDLLRACLWSGEEARPAWRRWRQRSSPDPKLALEENGAKSLLAWVHYALRRNDLEIEAAHRTAFAVAAVAEERRFAAYERGCAEAFGALQSASIPFLVLKGAALEPTVYPAPSLRHSHDLDLLVQGADRRRAGEAMRAARFEVAASPRTSTDVFLHASRLPLLLHERLLPSSFYALPAAEVRARAVACVSAGVEVQTLSAADHLVHVCGLASFCPRRHPLGWVCDAWYLIARHPKLDWEVVLRDAAQGHLALPLNAMLTYLAVELAAAVPGGVAERLAAAAARADPEARAAALAGVRAARMVGFRRLMRAAAGPREGWEIVRARLLAPPPPASEVEPVATAAASPRHRFIDGGPEAHTAFLRSALRLRQDPSLAIEVEERGRRLHGDWGTLWESIERERIGPLLYRALGAREFVPEERREALRQSYRLSGLRTLLFLGELRQCLGSLAAAGVQVIVLKGAALGEEVYGNVALRPMGDLDLLVRRRDMGAAAAVLEGLGFGMARAETHTGALAELENEVTFFKPGRVRVDVDLHWSLIDSPYHQSRIAMDWFWETARPQRLAEVPALTLGVEALLLHLCAHLSLHHGGRGLLWSYDIAELLRVAQGEIDWDLVLARGREYGLLLPLRDVLAELADDWGAAVPPEVLRRLRAESVPSREVEVVGRLRAGLPAGGRFWTDLAGIPGWRQRLRFARTSLVPSAAYMRERYGVGHPFLVPLYYPYRWWRGLRGSR